MTLSRITVSLDALRANARALRDLVAPAKAAFVVKGNAYGHGLVETARAIAPLASFLCVFALEEAVTLRDAGITAPLLILGPIDPSDLDDAIASRADIALWDTRDYVGLVARAAHARQQRIGVHVKVNTGLNRLGLQPDNLVDALEDYARISPLRIDGIFSHLASAEEIDSPFTMQQLATFVNACNVAQGILSAHELAPVRHIAASAAAMLWPQTRLDMARFGIALYGLWPSAQTREAMNAHAVDLRPALTYTSTLIVTRTIEAGDPVGYGTTYHAARSMRIGVVPVGYADGVPRRLSNNGSFTIDGARAPIVGRVAMNMTVVDLTHAPHAEVGADVTLFGGEGDGAVSADDWATWSDTINYEIVTRLPTHLPREYV